MTKITEYLEILFEGGDLKYQQAKDLLDTVFKGDVAEVQIAAFLAAMRMKKVAAAELAGLAQSLRDHAVKIKTKIPNLIDTCGTGGATLKTFNVSTASALVTAGAGAYVAKHGNRAITSKCGSADVLEAMGVKIDCTPELVAECIENAHIGFMFAPLYHPAMKFVQPIRKSLDFRTAFNILGPLANPAGAQAQVMGVPQESLLDRIAETFKILGLKRAMIVHGSGLDEISITSITKVVELKDGKTTSYQINPKDFEISSPKMAELIGSNAEYNAGLIKDILNGRKKGPARDMVLLNAAAAIMVAGLADDLRQGFKKAAESIDSGAAAGCLEKFIEISNKGK
ncbi:MAG: anthranilate phosphoribosyltransferase [Planctomycetes bacterium]|nr:anthranilate phosphoribosyltransferase [Planctomycetota bacterium]MBU1517695.1 anthranilate phosphoribosyltransferase [Planctomycetota bacterium]MBU2457234.1 anthranilate phosphoribosyltransferase [Planctomycetota bacterium]MBU2597205.1 anthranilate phosphoribosyltransferase [Planctomycetota bacterium]